jgi:ABC-type transport system involved in cytochrome bd biosynthesis fused ATPase/permease subunit
MLLLAFVNFFLRILFPFLNSFTYYYVFVFTHYFSPSLISFITYFLICTFVIIVSCCAFYSFTSSHFISKCYVGDFNTSTADKIGKKYLFICGI